MNMSSNKRAKLENSLPYLPYDVVEEILVRLPADSLLRFKSVNKSFYSLIQNPTFVSKQLHHQCKQNRSGFNHAVIFFPTNAMRYTVFFLESPDHNLVNWDHIVCSIYNMPNTGKLRVGFSMMVGHCNGLICLRTCMNLDYQVYSLWNPVLRQRRIAPLSHNKYRSINKYILSEGFGYDPKSLDYKIIRLSHYYRQGHVLADVYSLRTDSWRPVPDPLCVLQDTVHPPDYYKMDSVCLGGFCYWSEVYSVVILSFDFSNEVFRAMYLPEQVYLNPSVRLMAWNESVAVITFDKQEKKRFRVWLLDFHNHVISIKEEFTVDLNIEDLNDVKLVWNDNIILDMCSPLAMTYYNTTTLKTKVVPFDEVSDVKCFPFEELSHHKKPLKSQAASKAWSLLFREETLIIKCN